MSLKGLLLCHESDPDGHDDDGGPHNARLVSLHIVIRCRRRRRPPPILQICRCKSGARSSSSFCRRRPRRERGTVTKLQLEWDQLAFPTRSTKATTISATSLPSTSSNNSLNCSLPKSRREKHEDVVQIPHVHRFNAFNSSDSGLHPILTCYSVLDGQWFVDRRWPNQFWVLPRPTATAAPPIKKRGGFMPFTRQKSPPAPRAARIESSIFEGGFTQFMRIVRAPITKFHATCLQKTKPPTTSQSTPQRGSAAAAW